jgi:DNA-binding IclR family transcriptional regulator
MSIPLYSGAAGKCLLAFLPEKEALLPFEGKQLVKFTPNTIVNKKAIVRELRKIREQGYAESREEYFEDAAALAFPLFNSRNDILAAYSIHSTINRLTDKTREQFIREGRNAAQETNQILKNIYQV